MEIRFLGHSCFELTEGSTRVLIDPFLSENPLAAAAPADLDPTHLFLTHGHFDHLGDTVDIAKRSGAFCVASKELAGELTEDGIENIADPLLGGTVEFEGGWVRLVPAWHFGPHSSPPGWFLSQASLSWAARSSRLGPASSLMRASRRLSRSKASGLPVMTSGASRKRSSSSRRTSSRTWSGFTPRPSSVRPRERPGR